MDLSDISPHLSLRVSPRARRLSLRLDPLERKIHVIVPKRASLRAAHQFARDNKAWIESKLATLPATIPFAEGEKIPVFDKTLTIQIDRHTSYKTTRVFIDGNILMVQTKLDEVSGRITRFLKKHAEIELKKMADEKAALTGKKITKLTLRDMKTRWGSCSTDGSMVLNWRLIFAPFAAYDYVIAHEAAHLIHPHHKSSFWKLCEELSADYSTGHTWMRDYSNELMRFVPKVSDPDRIAG